MVYSGLQNDMRSSLFSVDLKACTIFEFLISSGMDSILSHLYVQRHSGQVPCGILAAIDHDSGEYCNRGCLIS